MGLKHQYLRIVVLLALLFGLVSTVPTHAQPLQETNNWAVGNIVGLCQGTKIYQGSSYIYPYHTIVPENGWATKIIGGPRYADGKTWWNTSRYAAGDPSGGTGWIPQEDAGNCPVGSGGGGGTDPGDGGGGTDPGGGGGTPLPCSQITDFWPNIASPEIKTPLIEAGTTATQYAVQATARNVCKTLVTLPFTNEKWYLPNYKVDWDNGELEYNRDTLEPSSGQVNVEVTEKQGWSSGVDENGPYTAMVTKSKASVTSRFDLESQNTMKVYPRPAKQPAYVPNWAFSSSYLKEFYYMVLAAAMIAVVIAGGIIIGGATAPAYATAALIVAIGMWFTQMTGKPLPSSVQQSSLLPGTAQRLGVYPVAYRASSLQRVLTEPPSGVVRDAMRAQYGPLADMAVATILTPSKVRVSAYTVFEFQGTGFSPDSDILVVFSSVEGNNQLLGGIFHSDSMGRLQGSLTMPDPEHTPLGTYLLSAIDRKSLEEGVANVVTGKSTQLNVVMGGALIEVVVDSEPPVITIASPQAETYSRCDQPMVSFSVVDELSGVAWVTSTLDDQPVVNGSTIDLLFAGLGSHTIAVRSADKVGNASNLSVDYQLQSSLPGLACAVERFAQMGLISKDGVANGLLAKIDAARASSERGQITATRNQIGAFVQLLKAQQGKSVSDSAWKILNGDAGVLLQLYSARQ